MKLLLLSLISQLVEVGVVLLVVNTSARFILTLQAPCLCGVLSLEVMTCGRIGMLAGLHALLWVGTRELASRSLRDSPLTSNGLLTRPRLACGGHTVLQLLILSARHLARVDNLLTHLGALM